ncbi:YIP1 family protein [Geothrix sp. 21YS21S-4]|uniref:YIP1 family protein n=1 Tax=Geothrix sp. 21YS21S-4 TaxID=3068889 RepID=UPI0027B999D4|nr:YIP1 family protein [Geothrix sp. 21YS21S-4]
MSDQPTSLYGDQPQAPPPPPGLMDQLAGVFTEPKALMLRLRQRPVWIGALLLAVGIGIVAGLIWASKVDMAEMTRHQMERTRDLFHMNIPDQAMEDAISKAEGKKPWLSAVSGAVFAIPFVYLVVALIVWGFAAMGTEDGETSPTFGQAFSVTCVHYLVTLPATLLAGIIALLRPVGGHSLQQLMPTVLSFYVSPESGFVRGLLALVDPLWIFSFVVLALGMRHALKTKTWAICACLTLFVVLGGGLRFVGGLFQ